MTVMLASPLVSTLARLATAMKPLKHLANIELDDEGHGYDAFGMNGSYVAMAAALMQPAYRGWFRVHSEGIEHIPHEGAALLVSNHGGLLPFDGTMIWTDVVTRMHPARVPRPVADYFVPLMPLVSTIYQRCGAVSGSRGNVHRLLEHGELVLLFPEGTAGVGKRLRDRYRLQRWSVGHAEMAIRHRVPVIPVSVVGPDEQMPFTLRLPLHPFGAPYGPFSLIPFPLPVRYHIDYGAPIDLSATLTPSDADDPVVVEAAARRVREALQTQIDRRRSMRRGLFA